MDSLGLAVQSTAHSTTNSAADLAAKLGLGYQVFINKVNPNNETHKLSLHEGLALMLHSKNPAIHFAMRDALYQAKVLDHFDEKPLIPAVIDVAAENGDVARVVADALEDGRLTQRERTAIIHEAREAIKAMEVLVLAVQSSSEAP